MMDAARLWLLPFVLILGTGLGAPARADHSPDPNADAVAELPITVLGDMNFPPYESLVGGVPVGANVDLWKAIARIIDRDLDMRLYQWADAQVRLSRGEGDVLSMVNINPDRRQLYDFTRATFTFRFPIFVRSHLATRFDTWDLSDKRIAVKRGGYPQAILENSHPGANMVFVDDVLTGFRMLLRGEIDGMVEEEWVGHYLLRQNRMTGIDATVRALDVRTAHIPVPKGDKDLLRQIDSAVAAIKASGEFDQILDRWASAGTIRIQRETVFAIVAAGIAGIALILLLGVAAYVFRVRRINAALVNEIAEREKLEEQLRRAHRLDAIGQLTGGIAHDFNNILATLAGTADILQERVEHDPQATRQVNAIRDAVTRAASLTSRLLAFARKQTLTPEATDLGGLIEGLADLLRRTLGATVDLRLDLPQGLWPAILDRHQFENALINLAINARDAMPRGGFLVVSAANVTLEADSAAQHEEVQPGDYVKIIVSDTGDGMTANVLAKVFEPFFTTKDVGKGSGLGLSMVYGFVKQSRGHIAIRSALGKGTAVEICLPRSAGVPAQKAPAPAPAAAPPPARADNTRRVLVVEDEEMLREVPVMILTGQGYEVTEAANGEEAIAHLKNDSPFDLLFTDMVLPGRLSGRQIADEARRLQPGIRVLFTTGYAEHVSMAGGGLAPGDTVIAKPYRKADLLAKVAAVLQG